MSINTLTIHHGTKTPFKARGEHQVALLEFAFKYQGWHSFKQDSATTKAVKSLEEKQCLVVDWKTKQFKINL